MFNSNELPNQPIVVSHGGQEKKVFSDQEGYIFAELFGGPYKPGNVHKFSLTINTFFKGLQNFSGECFVPKKDARYGIISDIDDTVLISEVEKIHKMLAWTFFNNHFERVAFKNVDTLYQNLASFDGMENINPVFYVSNSPWNLYPTIERFLDRVGLPKGAIKLRDFGLNQVPGYTHKLMSITEILNTYPGLKFLLMGDSAEQDAAIFAKIAEEFQDRIFCSYIRTPSGSMREELVTAQAKARTCGSEMIFYEEAMSVATHFRNNFCLQNRKGIGEIS